MKYAYPIFVFYLMFSGLSVSLKAQPAILSQPTDTSVCEFSTVTFRIIASNASYYQWQEFDGSGWFDIDENISYASGENSPQLTLQDVIESLNGYQYRCYVEDDQGAFLYSQEATLSVFESPLIINQPVNRAVCKNETAVFTIEADHVTQYQWQENWGSGWYNLDNNSFYQGTTTDRLEIFTILGMNDNLYRVVLHNNACPSYSQSAQLTVHPLPQVFYVLGGGTVCEHDEGAEIYLNSSQTGVNYELLKDGMATGVVKPGSGESLFFGLYNLAGTYTVRAIHDENACSNLMSGAATININPAPIPFSLSGNQWICAGGTGTNISLSGSQNGFTYQLLLQDEPTGMQLTGTGNSLTFENIQTPGNYTVYAVNPETSCGAFMSNEFTLTQFALPETYVVSGPDIICQNQTDTIKLSGSQEFVSYLLYKDEEPAGITLSGTGQPLNFFPVSSAGNYQILAINDTTGCERWMAETIGITIAPEPEIFDISAPSYRCSGEQVMVHLNGSRSGQTYRLLRNNQFTGMSRQGTGATLDFLVEEGGNYQIQAVSNTSGCQQMMAGIAVITDADIPLADAGPDREIPSGSSLTLQGMAQGGSGNYQFHWNPESLFLNANTSSPQTYPVEEPWLVQTKVTDELTGCLSEPDTMMITLSDGIFTVIAYPQNDSLCEGETIQLSALVQGGSGVYDYFWYSENGSFNADEARPFITPPESMHIIVNVSDGISTVADTVTLNVIQNPDIFSLSGDEGFCTNEPGAQLQLSGKEEDVTYKLFRNGFFEEIIATPENFLVAQQGTYVVKADRMGCLSQMEGVIEVVRYPVPTAFAGYDQEIYFGEQALLQGMGFTASGDLAWQWQPEELVEAPQAATTASWPLFASTDFSLRVTDNTTGCISTPDTIHIQVLGDPVIIEVFSSQEETCPGETVLLSVIASGGTENFAYTWYSNPSGFSANDSVATAAPVQSAWYIAKVDDGNMTVKDSVYITVKTTPEIFNLSGGGETCANLSGPSLTLSGSEIDVYYVLKNSDQEILQIKAGTGMPLSFNPIAVSGSYQAQAIHIGTSCAEVMEGNPQIFVHPIPTANTGENQTISLNQTALLEGFGTGGSGTYEYHWNPASMVINPAANTTETLPLTTSSIFFFEVEDLSTGCLSNPDTVLISVGGSALWATVQITNPVICQGEKTELMVLASGGTGQYTYSWTSDDPGFSAHIYNISVSPEQTTTYQVVIDDGENQITKETTIEVRPAPHVFAGQDTLVSNGQAALLQGTVSGGSGSYIYSWQPEGLTENPDSLSTVTIPLTLPTTFTFQAIDQVSGCRSNTDTVMAKISSNTWQINTIAFPTQVCEGKSVTISTLANTNTTLSCHWTSNPPGLDTIATTFQIRPAQTTTFYLEASDGHQTLTDSVSITVIDSPKKFVTQGNPYICGPQGYTTIELTASEPQITYQLIKNNLFTGLETIGNGGPLSFSPVTSSGFYHILAIEPNSLCSSVMPGGININVADNPNTFPFQTASGYCENENAVIQLEGSEPEITYLVMDNPDIAAIKKGNGTSLSLEFPVFPGAVQLKAVDSLTGCETLWDTSFSYAIYPAPTLTTTPDTSILRGTSLTLEASGADSIVWWTIPPQTSPFLTVSPDTTTYYRVTGFEPNGCYDSDSIKVEVISYLSENKINAFTPDGDGINDRFKKGYAIKVFNRWGKLLFEGSNGWDGTFKGKPVVPGTYYYIQTHDQLGNEIPVIKGSVTVIIKRN